ncbi:hypothetical protein [Motilimonas eburnea]|uniref:hypothetical protein n=1 Tax=Motilimonas eburnea TaxID=1737488 RepID=UPI001E29AB22|nr:hypothetical protein [Motilimonas eburnea]MCE2570420.1 hypothetical protein [Motilimonas eburnea]
MKLNKALVMTLLISSGAYADKLATEQWLLSLEPVLSSHLCSVRDQSYLQSKALTTKKCRELINKLYQNCLAEPNKLNLPIELTQDEQQVYGEKIVSCIHQAGSKIGE